MKGGGRWRVAGGRWFGALGAGLLIAVAPLKAQEPPGHRESTKPGSAGVKRHLGVWVATAGGVPMKSPVGVEHGSLVSLGVGMAWTLRETSFASLRYRVDAMPLMIFTEVGIGISGPCDSRSGVCVPLGIERGSVPAIGLAPVGIEIGTPVRAPAGLAVTGTGGFLFARHPIPYPTASRFNFMASAGVSGYVRLTTRLALTAEVQRAHVSNGRMKTDNPGLDYTSWRFGLRY